MDMEIKKVKDFEPYFKYFGWNKVGEEVTGLGKDASRITILSRDKDMANYDTLTELEEKYYQLECKKVKYIPVEAPTVIFLFILLIFPSIIYIVYKGNQKKEFNEKNAKVKKEQEEIVKQAKKLISFKE